MTAVATWPPRTGTAPAAAPVRTDPPRTPGRAQAPAAAGAPAGHLVAFTVAVVAVLAAGLTLLLLLHTWAAQDGFRLARLQQQQGRLATQLQTLQGADQQLAAPRHLQAAASQLGMRPAADPTIVRLHDGRLAAREVAVPLPPPVIPAKPAHKNKAAGKTTGKAAKPAGNAKHSGSQKHQRHSN